MSENASGRVPIDGGTLATILAGFIAFGSGAYLAATGERGVGIILMAAGLAFQMISLVRLRKAKAQAAQQEVGE